MWVPWVTDSEMQSACSRFTWVRNGFRNKTPKEGRKAEVGSGRIGNNRVVTKASDPTESSGARMALWNCSKWRQGGWVFVSQY